MSRQGLGCGLWRGILRSCSGDGDRALGDRAELTNSAYHATMG
jgi:hypothetical protein